MFSLKRLPQFVFFFSFIFLSEAQTTKDSLLNAYSNFGKTIKELVYVHINKSTFIKNETLGFSAYVFDKRTNLP